MSNPKPPFTQSLASLFEMKGSILSFLDDPSTTSSQETSSKFHNSEDYALEYHGPVLPKTVHTSEWGERNFHEIVAKTMGHETDPLLGLLQLSSLTRSELDDRTLVSLEQRCSLEYLLVCLFDNIPKAGSLSKDAVWNLRAAIRQATVEDGRISLDSPLPHPFGNGVVVDSFHVVKVLDATSRPKVVQFFSSTATSDTDNPDDQPIPPNVLYKEGDDLRQDLLILSSIAVFNMRFRNQWTQDETLPVPQTHTYSVLPWATRDGLIELVPNVTDQREWVQSIPAEHYFSSAAATVTVGWVLGIGDRHRRNILASQEGQVFHIDFGYAFGVQAPLESAQVPVPNEMYKDLNDQELWDVFCGLCLVLFDFIAREEIAFSRAIEAMAHTVGYEVPTRLHDRALGGFVSSQLSESSRKTFMRAIRDAPHSLKSQLKEAIIPLWYMQVKRFHKHKEAKANILGHVKVELEHYGSILSNTTKATGRLIGDMAAYSKNVQRELFHKLER